MMAVRNDAFTAGAHILWRPLYFTGASIAVRATLATCLAVLLFWMTRVPLAFSADATASQAQPSIKTEHRLSEPGISLPYEAVAGTLTLRDEAGRPQFSIFYTEDRVDAKRGQGRPIIFLWNGGPGWSSIWLRMGSFGPVRVKPTAVGSAPASLEENPDTLLPYADLVFLDAPETGYSRELPSARPSDYAGIDEDARVMTRAVEQYLDRNVAMGTAIYLLGESYGTLRAAVVARMLHDDGIQVSGLILMSCILGGGDLGDTRDRDYQTWLPTYAAIGAYYHKVAGSPADAAARAEAFAETTYAKALFAGSSLSRQDERTIAGELADLTGLSADYWFDDHLRVPIETFRRDLLMNDELGLSAHDARFAGPDFAPLGIRPSYDASDVALRDKYVAAMQTYFHHDLHYTTTLQYRLSAPPVSWDNRHLFPGAHEPALDDDVRPDISMMLREEPNFRVLALSGLYDLVTPYFLTEYDLNHLDAPLATMSRVQNFRLNSGHMIYADPSASKTVSSLIRQFLGEGAS